MNNHGRYFYSNEEYFDFDNWYRNRDAFILSDIFDKHISSLSLEQRYKELLLLL